jgi:hypothetical protein
MHMTSLGRLTGSAFKSSKRVAAMVATGLALATASVSSQAVEVVVGTLDVTPTRRATMRSPWSVRQC